MEIGKEVKYNVNNENKTGTITWKSDTHAFFKSENGEIEKVELKHVTVPKVKKGLLTRFLSLFR